jgi:hypothetical protein
VLLDVVTRHVVRPAAARQAAAGLRQWIPYCLPSSVREYHHQPPLRTGTDRSVSRMRALISSKRVAWSASGVRHAPRRERVLGLEVGHDLGSSFTWSQA